MNNVEVEKKFEQNKNLRALGITSAVTLGLFLIFFLISWTIPLETPPPADLGVEVNLGNSDFGSGTVAPQAPGEPSDAQQTNNTPPPPAPAVPAETEKEVIPNNDPNATPVNTSPKPEKKRLKEITKSAIKHTKPKVMLPPQPQKAKATMRAYVGGKSTGTGGNNADPFNNIRNQGIAGGNGDQGKANGDANSNNYTGNGGTGTSGVSANVFGRSISGTYHFEDSYQHGGTVMVDVTVDANGRVTSASARPGCPFPELNKIAERRAKQITFTKGTGEQTGSIRIKFEAPKG